MGTEVNHEHWMRHALDLALRGTGHVSPNPRVGCVIVHNGVLLAEGWHASFGGPHAEVHALSSLPSPPSDALLYVTLEPCSHHGKTPPCVNAIIASGIKTVIVGTIDPNPMVAGKGIEILREHGILVEVGVLHEECQWVNRAFATFIRTGRPYVLVKIAQSLDGKIAAQDGASKWITGVESRTAVHTLRSEADAILTGIGTVRADDPELTVRLVDGRSPARFIVDPTCSLDPRSKLARTAQQTPTVVCCTEPAATSHHARALRDLGVMVMGVPTTSTGRLDLAALTRNMATEHSIASIMVESGTNLTTAVLHAELAHEMQIFTAPILLGDGRPWNRGPSVSPTDARRWRVHSVDVLGPDVRMICVHGNG